MKERPILMSAPMVRATLDGTKTQTRRVAKKPVKHPDLGNLYAPGALVLEREPQHVIDRCCPYGQPGDHLWVREAWAFHPDYPERTRRVIYRADRGVEHDVDRWRPSIHMPRWASRTTLEIHGVRIERLQDISEADAKAEGMPELTGINPVRWYAELWETINGAGSWAANPWVWVVEFNDVSKGGAA